MTIYECVLTGNLDAQPMLHVLHYDITGSTNLQEWVDAFQAELSAHVMDHLVNSAAYSGITIREDVPGAVGVFYPFTAGTIAGTATGTNYWANVAALVRKFSDNVVRPNQGRLFQSGIPPSATDNDGKLGGSYVVALRDAWSELITVPFDSTGNSQMVIKASNPSAPNTVPYNEVNSIGVAGRLSTQRRRNFGT